MEAPHVILVHGLLRTGLSMAPMARGLRRRGFQVDAITQLNLHRSVPELADLLYEDVRRLAGDAPVHFVGHSLGGIVIRTALARHAIPGPTRAVLLGSPNQGSLMAEQMRGVLRLPWGDFDPLRKLRPGELGECHDTGTTDAELGVIAGAPSRPTGFPWSLAPVRFPSDRPHDGKVAVDEARLETARDFLVVPYGHTWLMARKDVIDQTAHFLREGRFQAA